MGCSSGSLMKDKCSVLYQGNDNGHESVTEWPSLSSCLQILIISGQAPFEWPLLGDGTAPNYNGSLSTRGKKQKLFYIQNVEM